LQRKIETVFRAATKGDDVVNQAIAWTDFPEEHFRKMRYVPVITCKPHAPLTAVIVGCKVVGVLVHFNGKRSTPCNGNHTTCVGCTLGSSTRWKGYLGVWIKNWSRYAIAEITVNAVRTCPVLVKDGYPLQGRTLRLERLGEKKNSPVKAELSPRVEAHEAFCKDFPLAEHLHQLWFGDLFNRESEVV